MVLTEHLLKLKIFRLDSLVRHDCHSQEILRHGRIVKRKTSAVQAVVFREVWGKAFGKDSDGGGKVGDTGAAEGLFAEDAKEHGATRCRHAQEFQRHAAHRAAWINFDKWLQSDGSGRIAVEKGIDPEKTTEVGSHHFLL